MQTFVPRNKTETELIFKAALYFLDFTITMLFFGVCLCLSVCLVCISGSRQVLFGCVERATQTTVPDDLCSFAHHPGPKVEDCQSQPCPAL